MSSVSPLVNQPGNGVSLAENSEVARGALSTIYTGDNLLLSVTGAGVLFYLSSPTGSGAFKGYKIEVDGVVVLVGNAAAAGAQFDQIADFINGVGMGFKSSLKVWAVSTGTVNALFDARVLYG